MKFSGFWAALTVLIAVFPYAAQADEPPVIWPDYERVYLENSKDPNLAQWALDPWRPQDWIESRGSAKNVIDDFYEASIITDRYDDDGQPVLEVGKGFMALSDVDRRRVAAFVDHVYALTAGCPSGMFYIYHWKTEEPIGMYTRYGLQIQ